MPRRGSPSRSPHRRVSPHRRERERERGAGRKDCSKERDRSRERDVDHGRGQSRERDRSRDRDAPRDRKQSRGRGRECSQERPRVRDERRDRDGGREAERERDRGVRHHGDHGAGERRWRSRSRDGADPAEGGRHGSPGRGGQASRYDERGGPRDAGAGAGSRGGGGDGSWRGGPGDGGGGRQGGRGGGRGGGRDRHDDRPPGAGGKEVWGRADEENEGGGKPPPDVVVEPIMELSGKLAAETNKVAGVVLKYQPPVDSAKPDKKWRLYVFKGDTLAEDEPLYLHRNEFCLFGRDKNIVDVLCAHPSISKQHAVLQYRKTSKPDEFGLDQVATRPYLMDLGAVNGTFLNGERIEAERYYELLPKDVIKFGSSTRDYVLLHEELTKGG